MDNKEEISFNYTYCAKEQEEIKAIREKYCTNDKEDKMTILRKLDADVTKKASAFALTFGGIGALILGIGMSLAMTNIGTMLGIAANAAMLIGIIIGVIGIILVCFAYPLYTKTLKTQRKKIAPEILRLADELLK